MREATRLRSGRMISIEVEEMFLCYFHRHTLGETSCVRGKSHELANGRRAREAHWAQEGHEWHGRSHLEMIGT